MGTCATDRSGAPLNREMTSAECLTSGNQRNDRMQMDKKTVAKSAVKQPTKRPAKKVAKKLGAARHDIVKVDLARFGGSALTADIAQKLGYTKVFSLGGVYKALVQAKWPMTSAAESP